MRCRPVRLRNLVQGDLAVLNLISQGLQPQRQTSAGVCRRFRRGDAHVDFDVTARGRGAVRTLHIIVTAKMVTTTARETPTGIL